MPRERFQLEFYLFFMRNWQRGLVSRSVRYSAMTVCANHVMARLTYIYKRHNMAIAFLAIKTLCLRQRNTITVLLTRSIDTIFKHNHVLATS